MISIFFGSLAVDREKAFSSDAGASALDQYVGHFKAGFIVRPFGALVLVDWAIYWVENIPSFTLT